jgi:hypothetical protein
MIRTAALAVLTLGAMTAPAFAFGTQSVPAPKGGGAFSDLGILQGMMPRTTSAAFHFGPAEPPALVPDRQESSKPTVVYELKGDKSAGQLDVTNARDNPFMTQFGPSTSRSPQIAH